MDAVFPSGFSSSDAALPFDLSFFALSFPELTCAALPFFFEVPFALRLGLRAANFEVLVEEFKRFEGNALFETEGREGT